VKFSWGGNISSKDKLDRVGEGAKKVKEKGGQRT